MARTLNLELLNRRTLTAGQGDTGIPIPPLEPLHRYKLGKYESELRSHPLQTRYKAVTGGVTKAKV